MQATSELRQSTSSPTLADNGPLPHPGPDPVRVCFLIDELATAGTETQLVALIRRLDRSRVSPYLCLLRGDDPRSRALEPGDCPTLRLGVRAFKQPTTLAAAVRFNKFLRQERIDVLQVYFPDSTYFGIPLGYLAGVPCRVRTCNNLGHWLTRGHRILGKLLSGMTTHTIANCNAARAALLAEEGPDPDSVIVLQNGVDGERFASVPPLRVKTVDEVIVIGAVANLRAVKGLELLIEAARRLLPTNPQLRFRVAGEGAHRGPLEQLIRDYGVINNVELVGSVADIPAFLGELDIAVLCSHAEGLPNAVLEYMAAGRAIVATEVGAVADLLADGVHGLLVPPGNATALADAIQRLLWAPKLAVALADAARQRVLQHYSREAMVRRFEDFYVGVARQRGSAA